MLNPQKAAAATHADSFIQRYERLHAWALQLTERDHERAEDLLHDAFIQFTLSHPDLTSIDDLDSYLYVCLRNLHLSQMRRATRTANRELSIIEYDSAELGLWSIDPRDQIKTQDELRTVCHYACRRRKTSKAGSVLILRFFHGYYPEEIASVLRITRPAVKDRLRLARAEANLYLHDSDRLNLIHDKRTEERPRAEVGRVSDDLLNELRQSIFASCEGVCFSRRQLDDLYADNVEGGLSADAVAHLVACAKCLDEVNKLLGLPLLAERYASDISGKDTRKKGGGGSSGKGGSGLKESLNSYFRRARQVYRHEPQELCIAVNGYLQSTQKISSRLNELTLIVDTAEQIGFVEVFSEQGVRLLLRNVEPLPVGPVRQDARVELSEGRTLDASLSFSGAWPTLHVIYQHPLAQDLQEQLVSEDLLIRPKPISNVFASATEETAVVESKSPPKERSLSLLRAGEWSQRVFQPSFWLRPATITAVFAVFLVIVFAMLWRSNPAVPVTAADLLQRATQAEEMAMSRPDTVIHRTFQLEERRDSIEGEVLAVQRVELWQSAAKGITARRLYDSGGRLLAGEWTRSDNVSTFYNHAVRPRIQNRNPQSAIAKLDIWQISPSAKDFAAIVGDASNLHLEERANQYVLTFANATSSIGARLVDASLTIGRDDLHPVEEILTLQDKAELRVYRISETSLERRPLSAVAPAVFEPEPELLGEAGRIKGAETTREAAVVAPSAPPILATPELELEVLRLLNGAGGDLSDQVSVTRTTEGRLRVEGIVENSRRKADILRALSPIANHPAVKISVETVAETEQRQPANANPKTIELQQVEIAKGSLPIEPELRRYFANKGLSPEQLDQEVNRFASRVMHRSLQARLYARTLKQMINRFSPDDLRALTPEAREKLMTLIRSQAAGLQRELVALRSELRPIVPSAAGPTEQIEIGTDADLLRAINRLGEFVSQIDEGVRASLSLSSQGSGEAPVKGAEFWRSLKSAESLTVKINKQ
jgi:RNA polymerase sigma factor (sigma-70 family)